jgi:hypothetical protein
LRWNDLYLSGDTIYLGDSTISSSSDGILFGGVGAVSLSDLVNTSDVRLSDARIPVSHGNEAHTSTFVDAAGAAAAAPVQSVNTQTGTVVLGAADVGADPAGTAATAVSNHNSTTTSVHGIANTANLVTGAASSTDNHLALFSGTTGKEVKQAAFDVDDVARLSASQTFAGTNTFSSPIGAADGAVGTPSVTFASDLNTGMWRPAADTVAFSTNGAERWRITSGGIFEAPGAQTIRTATGALTLATAAGNGNIIFSPHGTGNVGIGTTSPAQLLSVSGAGGVAISSNSALTTAANIFAFQNGGTNRAFVGIENASGAGLFGSNDAFGLSIGTPTNTGFNFATNNLVRMRIASDGKVGIGTTSPSGPLDVVVSSPNDAYNAAIFTGNNAGGGQGGQIGSRTISANTTQGLYVHSVNSTTVSAGVSLRFQVGTLPATATDTSTERMRIAANGNVGIGTTSPVALGTNYTTLDIRGTTGGGHRFGNSTDSGIIYADSNATVLGSVTSKPLSLVTNNTVKMSIAADGKVGIGTTSPDSLLHVGTATALTGGEQLTTFGFSSMRGIWKWFTTPDGAGTFTITLSRTTNFIAGVILDVDISGGFSTTNREGHAAYRVYANRETTSVEIDTVKAPTNRFGAFTTNFTFAVTKPDTQTIVISIGKDSGAIYYVGLKGFFLGGGAIAPQTISTAFV